MINLNYCKLLRKIHKSNVSHFVVRTVTNNSAINCENNNIVSYDEENKDSKNINEYSEIPGPVAIPFLGNSWRFLPIVGQYKLDEVDVVSTRLNKQYGDIVKIEKILGRPDMVFLFDANEVEKVFRNEDSLPYRPSMPSLNYYKHVLRKDFFGDVGGVIAVHGESWFKFRSKVQQPLLQPRVIKLYSKDIERTAQLFIDRIRKTRNSRNEVGENFLNDIHLWSLESIAQVALDIKLGCLDESIKREDTQLLIDAINTFFKNVGVMELKIPFWKIWSTPTWKKYIEALDTITNVSLKYVMQAMEKFQKVSNDESKSQQNASLLQRVLLMDPTNPKIATILALDLFLVGIDTTSAAIASILYQLSRNPEKQQILYEEIKSVLPNPKDELTVGKMEKLSYLKACIKETFRMYPVVIGNGRCLTKDMEICGYKVPEGVQIIFQHCVMSNSEKYFQNPNSFIPERWLTIDGNKPDHHPFASLPFGFGKRMCLGRRFADLEIQTLIIKIVQNFKIEYHHELLQYKVQPMYLPKGPLKFAFHDHD